MRLPLFIFATAILLFTSVFSLQAQAPVQDSSTAFFARSLNGMSSVLMPIAGMDKIEFTLYVRAGTVYETDSLSGISNIMRHALAQKVVAFMNKSGNSAFKQNTTFNSYSTSEVTIYKFSCGAANAPGCLRLLKDSVFLAYISLPEIDSAKAYVIRQLDSASRDSFKVFQDKMNHSLFHKDYQKIKVEGDTVKFPFIDDLAVEAYQKKYYVPNNTVISAVGNIAPLTFQNEIEAVLKPLVRGEFDHEIITKIVDFHPVLYNTQFITNIDSVTPEFQICWQIPGTFTNQRSSYCATLLCEMLNDKNNYLQIKAAKMGCKKFTVQYEANCFSGVLRITLQPDKQHLVSTCRFVVNEICNLNKTLINESMINMGKLFFARDYANLKKDKVFADLIVKNWPFNDETYYVNLKDSIMPLREREMKKFGYEVLNQGSYTIGLMISKADCADLKIDSSFTNIDENIRDYTFTYKQNVTDLEGDDNLSKRNNLLQWLLINKDMYIKVNGFADEGEFNKTYDDSIKIFIDSLPEFRKTMPGIIKVSYLRPEMMRAMKIIKFLYDNGIEPERLAGTSMLAHSADKKEAEDNMKCTLTLDKYRKSESHYQLSKTKKE